jgi:DNA modification methylase
VSPTLQIIQGDALERLRWLSSDSVHCVVTSPPYWGLRDYGTAQWEGGDPDCEHSVGGQVQQTKAGTDPNAVGVRPGVDAWSCKKCGANRNDLQIGLEETPELWVAKLVDVFREVRRVLHPSGTLWCNVGDAYNSRPGDPSPKERLNNHTPERDSRSFKTSALKPKDLIGLPWALAFALRDDGWWLRCDIIWHKPNPMPESVTDRPTKSHEYVFLLTKRANYFYDAEAVKEPQSQGTFDRFGNGNAPRKTTTKAIAAEPGIVRANADYKDRTPDSILPDGCRNKRSVWTIPTEAYSEAHFATFPTDVVKPCILAGTSAKGVCNATVKRLKVRGDLTEEELAKTAAYLQQKGLRSILRSAEFNPADISTEMRKYFVEVDRKCGAPYERIIEKSGGTIGKGSWVNHDFDAEHGKSQPSGSRADGSDKDGTYQVKTLGWKPTCPCEAGEPIPATCLDPFLGSGTTAAVALELGRSAVGIELSESYCLLAKERCGRVTPGLMLA